MNNQMKSRKTDITPQTKIAALIEDYPQLEEILIKLAPEFKKLRNPLMRKTIAKLATLQQAAEISKLPVSTLVNELRKVAGQDQLLGKIHWKIDRTSDKPEWVSGGSIKMELDARSIIERGEHPIGEVTDHLKLLKENQLFVLITSFIPAPLIELAGEKSYKSWTTEESPEVVKTYFAKNNNTDKK
ncbi:MAG: DUF1858 domain-containing protein [Calditrichaeota bacterium]|nr:DUF1858 domain-containing protein [Calditrichota bacterium]